MVRAHVGEPKIMIKIEICSVNDVKSGKHSPIHMEFLRWQRENKLVKCKLSHDKRFVTFDEEQYFDEFVKTWTKVFRRLY